MRFIIFLLVGTLAFEHLLERRARNRAGKGPTRQAEGPHVDRISQNSGAVLAMQTDQARIKTSPSRYAGESGHDMLRPTQRRPPSTGSKKPDAKPAGSAKTPSPPRSKTEFEWTVSGKRGEYPGATPVPGEPYWLDAERKRLAEFRQRSIGQTPDRSWKAKAAEKVSIEDANNKKQIAKSHREVDDLLNKQRQRIRPGPGTFPVKENTRAHNVNTIQAMSAYSQAEGSTAMTYVKNGDFEQAAKHIQKSHRAIGRANLRRTYGNAADFAFIHRWAQNDPTVKGDTHTKYKNAAGEYHEAYKDYRKIRKDFAGSSSSESESGDFQDILRP